MEEGNQDTHPEGFFTSSECKFVGGLFFSAVQFFLVLVSFAASALCQRYGELTGYYLFCCLLAVFLVLLVTTLILTFCVWKPRNFTTYWADDECGSEYDDDEDDSNGQGGGDDEERYAGLRRRRITISDTQMSQILGVVPMVTESTERSTARSSRPPQSPQRPTAGSSRSPESPELSYMTPRPSVPSPGTSVPSPGSSAPSPTGSSELPDPPVSSGVRPGRGTMSPGRAPVSAGLKTSARRPGTPGRPGLRK